MTSERDHLVRSACRVLVENPASGDRCEHGNTTAGAALALDPGVLRREAESPLRL